MSYGIMAYAAILKQDEKVELSLKKWTQVEG